MNLCKSLVLHCNNPSLANLGDFSVNRPSCLRQNREGLLVSTVFWEGNEVILEVFRRLIPAEKLDICQPWFLDWLTSCHNSTLGVSVCSSPKYFIASLSKGISVCWHCHPRPSWPKHVSPLISKFMQQISQGSMSASWPYWAQSDTRNPYAASLEMNGRRWLEEARRGWPEGGGLTTL